MPNAEIRGVVFDAFGTLVDIGERRGPYRQLLQLALAAGRPPRSDDARQVMTRSCRMDDIAKWLGFELSLSQLSAIESDLEVELASVAPFPDARLVLSALRGRGLRLGICSNLASPYAAPIQALLPSAFDAYAWSFEVGAVKPEPAIYSAVCRGLDLPPEAVLFIGDTYEADVAGPRAFGMGAVHLARDRKSPDATYLTSLAGLLEILM